MNVVVVVSVRVVGCALLRVMVCVLCVVHCLLFVGGSLFVCLLLVCRCA